jgi:FAD/FMN-containing dehydrogenase
MPARTLRSNRFFPSSGGEPVTDSSPHIAPNERPDPAVDAFRRSFQGEVLLPADAGYDAARHVFNAMVDRRPRLIARPRDAAGVQACVRFARDHGLQATIRGGGHSAPGHAVCDDGLMIDLSGMRTIEVDPEARIARAGGGATWGPFDAATQAHGLAVTGGRIRSTGIGGLTLGSGSGWLERKLGFTVDSLVGAQVVLASGEIVEASERDHADLFWGLRGGGGNFGVVTRFDFRLHPLGPIVYGGLLGFGWDRALPVLRAYRDFIEAAPDEVCGGVALATLPPEPFLPESLRGQWSLLVVVLYAGDPADGERAFAPLLALEPELPMTQPMPYVDLQGLLEAANPPGRRNYWKADMYPELPDAAMEALVQAAGKPRSPFTAVLVQPFGGHIASVPDDATAMGWRGAKWSLHVLGAWEDAREDEAQIAWVRSLASALGPWAQKGGYLNYLMDEGEGRVRDSFGAHYARMVALKTRYDPTNFFCHNQNIRPGSAA